MWRTTGICGRSPNSCGASCGTGRMSKFLWRTPCAASEPGHRTLPPIHQRGSRKAEPQADRGSGRSEDPHREATCGVGPVTGSAGSESRSDRGGRHPASSPEGLLVLIPSRGPHLASTRVGPAGPRVGNRVPAGLPDGARVSILPTVLPWGDSGNPDHRRFAGGGTGPGSQPVRRRRCRARPADRAPHREATRGAGPVTGTVGAEHGLVGEVDVTTPPRPDGLLVLIPPGDLHTPIARQLAGGRSGPVRYEDPHCEATRGVGPVTGTAGSESRSGRGGRHHFRLTPEGPSACSYQAEGPSPLSGDSAGRGPSATHSGHSR